MLNGIVLDGWMDGRTDRQTGHICVSTVPCVDSNTM